MNNYKNEGLMCKVLSLLKGLLTEIQCKSKRLRKSSKASPGQSTGDETEAGDLTDSKQVTSTTKLSKVSHTVCQMACINCESFVYLSLNDWKCFLFEIQEKVKITKEQQALMQVIVDAYNRHQIPQDMAKKLVQ